MITVEYVHTMARYNQWQNTSIYSAADKIGEEARKADRGAFFGSIHQTLSHLLWGDQIWMSRFAGTQKPEAGNISESKVMIEDWRELSEIRKSFDEVILNWASDLCDGDILGDHTWFSGAAGKEITKPFGFLIMHMFNHQTHHRGQVHAMITACGGKTDDTDLFYLK